MKKTICINFLTLFLLQLSPNNILAAAAGDSTKSNNDQYFTVLGETDDGTRTETRIALRMIIS